MARNWTILALFAVVCCSMGRCDLAKKYKLSSGHEMPVVGLGTGSLDEKNVEAAVLEALDSGYRHIDTAFIYKNEKGIGRALKQWFDKGNKREDVFITSKLPFWGNRASDVEKYLTMSLKDLGLDYLDMYLIHAPVPFVPTDDGMDYKKIDGKPVYDDSFDLKSLWKQMEEEVAHGHVKSIGMSNFNSTLVDMIYHDAKIKPSNLQVETHAYFQQKPLRQFAKDHDILVTGYAPIGSPNFKSQDDSIPKVIEHPIVKELSEKYKKSPAQILLRHGVQGGLVVIPKSSNPKRIKENIDIFDFELSEDDMKKLDTLDLTPKGRVYDFGLFYPGLADTPYYSFRAPETYHKH